MECADSDLTDNNNISKDGALALAQALSNNTTLIRVGLTDNPFVWQSQEIKKAIDDQLWANRSYGVLDKDCATTDCNALCMPNGGQTHGGHQAHLNDPANACSIQ